jgi:hypothetical protein
MILGLCSYLFLTLLVILTFLSSSACNFIAQDISTSNPIWFELLKGIPVAIVTLGLGLLASYIAWHQYQVERAKLKLDLFEKRLEIYQITDDFLINMMSPNLSVTDINKFKSQIDKASFLFGSDVKDYLDEILKKAQKINCMQSNPGAINNNYQNQFYAKLSKWFPLQRSDRLNQVFRKYLDFNCWH